MQRQGWTVALLFLGTLAVAQEPKQEGKTEKKKPSDQATTEGRQEPSPKPPQAQPRREQEKEITVIGSRMEQGVYEVPQSVTVVTSEEIARRLQRTPAEMLREEPGLWVQQTGHAGGAPILRGMIGNRVLYLWDGIRINNGALFGGPNAFFNQIQPGGIERMEVIRGPAAVQYGSDAIGGVINVVTKRGADFPKELRFGGGLHVQYGSADREWTEFADVSVAGPGVSAIVGGTLQRIDDYTGGRGIGVLEETGFKDHGYFTSTGFKLSDDQTLTVGWQSFRRENVENYVQSKLNASGRPRLFGPFDDRSLLKIDHEAVRLGSAVSELKSYAYFQNFEARSHRLVENATAFNLNISDGHQWIVGGGIQGVTRLGSEQEHRIVYGVDYRYETLRSDLTLESTSKTTGTTTSSKPAGRTPDGTYDAVDVFALAELQVVKGWTVAPGLRYESTHLNSNPGPLDPVAPFTEDDLDINERWNSVTWSLGTVAWLSDQWNIAGNIATGFRAPTFSDTLNFGVPVFATGVASIPSPGVGPEKAITYELGPRFISGDWQVSLTGYWSVLSDVIQSELTGGTVVVPGVGTVAATQNRNSGRIIVRGFDLAAAYRLTNSWTLFSNYSEAYGQDTKNDVPARFIPPRNGQVGVRWEEPVEGGFWVEGFVRYADRKRRPATDDKIDAGFSQDPALGSPNSTTNPPLRSGFQIPGYALYVVRGGVRVFKTEHSRGDLTLSVENVTDKAYRQATSRQLAEPGTNVILALDVRF